MYICNLNEIKLGIYDCRIGLLNRFVKIRRKKNTLCNKSPKNKVRYICMWYVVCMYAVICMHCIVYCNCKMIA